MASNTDVLSKTTHLVWVLSQCNLQGSEIARHISSAYLLSSTKVKGYG